MVIAGMRNAPCLLFLAALLAGCDGKEVRFCERFTKAEAHAAGSRIEVIRAEVGDRPLTSIEAARLLFPNYQGPNASFKRRPGDVPALLDLIASARPAERTVSLQFRIRRPDAPPQEKRRECTFLALNGSTQYIKDYHLSLLNIERVLAEEKGRKLSCCLRQTPEVR